MITIPLSNIKSNIAFTSQKLEALSAFLKKNKDYSNVLMITDHLVFQEHGENLLSVIDQAEVQLVEPLILPAGESTKSLAMAEQCWTHMLTMGLDRKSLILGFGGGVITDLAGFAASCFMRGIDTVLVPTTLMGMVDAAVGGKTAVNLPAGKNLIGTFHQPRLIIVGPHFLNTLPNREFHAGLAEVIKYGVIWDREFFDYVERHIEEIIERREEPLYHIIKRSCEIKADIVQQDEKESGLRAILNWGHTFAHAIETMTHYTTYLHGEAVAIGMCCAAYTSKELGFVEQGFVDKIVNICKRANLPIKLPNSLHLDEMIDLMAADKKAVSRKINLIVAKEIGKVDKVNDVEKGLLKKALIAMRNSQ